MRDDACCPSLFADKLVTEREYIEELRKIAGNYAADRGGAIGDIALGPGAPVVHLSAGFPEKPLQGLDVSAAISRALMPNGPVNELDGAALELSDAACFLKPPDTDIADKCGLTASTYRSYMRRPGAQGRREIGPLAFSKLVDGCARIVYEGLTVSDLADLNGSGWDAGHRHRPFVECSDHERRYIMAHRLLGIRTVAERERSAKTAKRDEEMRRHDTELLSLTIRAASLDAEARHVLASTARLLMGGRCGLPDAWYSDAVRELDGYADSHPATDDEPYADEAMTRAEFVSALEDAERRGDVDTLGALMRIMPAADLYRDAMG